MGCDIHAYIEYQTNKEIHPNNWWKVADLHLLRNYAMFGLMAGVRGGDALIEPRGYPMDSATRYDYCLFVVSEETEDSECCTRANAERWVANGTSEWANDEHSLVTHPDWHTPSWLTGEEYRRVIEAYKADNTERGECPEYEAALAMLESLPNSRIVFWFDN
jgi:hypothetical protein